LEKHHRTPKCQGCDDSYKNLWLIHTSCHIQHHIDFPAKGPIPTKIELAQARKQTAKRFGAGTGRLSF